MADRPAARAVPPGFPTTRWSRVDAAARDAAVLDELLRTYRRPIEAYLAARWRLPPEDVSDRAQEFFLTLLERELLPRADARRGRFRTFVRAILDSTVVDAMRRERAERRGGGRAHADVVAADPSDPRAAEPAAELDREWRRTLVENALGQLRAELDAAGHASRFAIFRDWYVADGATELDHATLAARHGLRRHDVSNHLRFAKTRFRALIERAIRETVATRDDLDRELAWFFGDTR